MHSATPQSSPDASPDASHHLIDLAATFRPDPAGANRELIVNLPGLTVLHLSLRPGQRMPVHDHRGCHVTIQGLVGTATVLLDGAAIAVEQRQLLSFPGERQVSPGNDSDEDCAVLITLVERPVATAA